MSRVSEDTEAVLRRVKKLVALGESPVEAEAEAAMEKAHALLLKHGLSMTSLEGLGEDGKPLLNEMDAGIEEVPKWANGLAGAVARSLGGEAIIAVAPWCGMNDPVVIGRITFIGPGETPEGMLQLYTFLRDRITLEAKLHAAEAEEPRQAPGISIFTGQVVGPDPLEDELMQMLFGGRRRDPELVKQSFEIGMVGRIGQRLQERADAIAAAESYNGQGLVLARDAVRDHLEQTRGDALTPGTAPTQDDVDPAAANRGASAANRLPLSPEVEGGPS